MIKAKKEEKRGTNAGNPVSTCTSTFYKANVQVSTYDALSQPDLIFEPTARKCIFFKASFDEEEDVGNDI